MAKNSAEGNKARTARYRAGLAARGIRSVQVLAPEAAHALLKQAAELMTREQDPLDPRQALRKVGGANDADKAGDLDGREQALVANLEAAKAELAAMREESRQSEQRAVAQAGLAVAEAKRAEAAEGVAAAAQEAERAARDAAAELRQELDAIAGKRGWRGLLLRVAGAKPRSKPTPPAA